MHEGGLSKGGSRVVFLVAMATLAAFFKHHPPLPPFLPLARVPLNFCL